jgi:hypothetical protein
LSKKPRRSLFVDQNLIDVTLPVPDTVLVWHETLHRLRTLPWDDAAKLLSQIILAAERDGAIKPGVTEKRIVRAHRRVIEKKDAPPHHDDEPAAAREYRRDNQTLGVPRPDGRPKGRRSKTGQERR